MKSKNLDNRAVISSTTSIKFSSKSLGSLTKLIIGKGNQVKFKAKGSSMFPFIKDGDAIVLSPYFNIKPELGDIVAYLDSQTKNLVIHRIISITGYGFIPKGDSCLHSDEYQLLDNIVGYVPGVNEDKPGKKRILIFLSRLGVFYYLKVLLRKLDYFPGLFDKQGKSM